MQQPSGFGRLDFYVGAFLAALGTVAGVSAVIALWPWHVLVFIVLILIGLGVIGVRIYYWIQHHEVRLVAERNRAIVLHDVEGGFGVLQNGQIMHYTHVTSPAPIALPEVAGSLARDEKPDYPTDFTGLVRAGYIAPGNDFILGFDPDTGEALRMPVFSSLGISGVSGSGKTVTTLSLMMQAVAKYNGRIKFLIADPHMFVAGDESLVAKVKALEPFFLTIEDVRATVLPDDHDYHALLNRLARLQNPTEGGEELAQWMKIVEMEMDRRKHGKVGMMWVIVMDEFAAIMSDNKTARPVGQVLEAINREARKMSMFSLLISQEWLASRLGGSELRHSAPSYIIHNTPESVAGLIVPSDIAAQAPTLTVGEIIAYSRGVSRRGRVPYATEEDAERIVNLYAPWQPGQVRVMPVAPGSLPAPSAATVPLLSGQTTVVDGALEPLQLKPPAIPDEFTLDELEQVREAFASGLEVADIAKRVYGVKAGPELAEAKIKVRDMLKWMVQNANW